jgi:hypothetical protein
MKDGHAHKGSEKRGIGLSLFGIHAVAGEAKGEPANS